jgi:CDGSH-type Zn-finger protein
MKNGKIVLSQYSPLMAADVSLINAEGEPVETPRVYSICRCGKSGMKPFCDGTHSSIGFTGQRKEVDRQPAEKHEGKEITIVYDRHLCMGAGHCGELEAVFGTHDNPKYEPDGASADEIIETIRKCPSGALSYIKDGEHHQNYCERQELVVEEDGPLHVHGGVELIDDQESDKLLTDGDHYTLCRCGASRKKPLCDGTHLKIGFKG